MRLALVTLAVLAVGTLVILAQTSGAPWQTDTRSKAGLRGPVRTCSEETITGAPGASYSFVQTTEYSPEGRVMSQGTRTQDASEWITTYDYDSAGHLLRSTSGRADATPADRTITNYTQDDSGMPIPLDSTGRSSFVKFGRDDQGRRMKIVSMPEPPPGQNLGAVSAGSWEGGELPLGAPPNGSIITIYDKHGLPIEGESHDAEGHVVSRIVRSYDAKGRMTGDRLMPVNTTSAIPAELAAKLNPEQMKTMGAFIGAQFSKGQTAFKYDDDGRLIERRRSLPVFGNEITTISYNEHGDVSLERTAQRQSQDMGIEYGLADDGKMVPTTKPNVPPPTVSEMHYEYVYDSHGNWTSRKVYASGQTEPQSEQTRTLTYY